MLLGIEIGGTKLQLGLGRGDGVIRHAWRAAIDPAAGRGAILVQIVSGVGDLLSSAGSELSLIRAAGVGFGGPVDVAAGRVVTSHQVGGWDDFPLGDWLATTLGLPSVIANDADAAGLAEATFGAGRGVTPVFYVTLGSGVGGGLVLDGRIYPGAGRGAAEIGHLPVTVNGEPGELEDFAAGWAVARRAGAPDGPTAATRARAGDPAAVASFAAAVEALSQALAAVVLVVCPRRVVVGGGLSLVGDDLLFGPLRAALAARVFRPFAGLTDIVPAALGEAVVVHGALALAAAAAGG